MQNISWHAKHAELIEFSKSTESNGIIIPVSDEKSDVLKTMKKVMISQGP